MPPARPTAAVGIRPPTPPVDDDVVEVEAPAVPPLAFAEPSPFAIAVPPLALFELPLDEGVADKDSADVVAVDTVLEGAAPV